jgi:hypothetical protein
MFFLVAFRRSDFCSSDLFPFNPSPNKTKTLRIVTKFPQIQKTRDAQQIIVLIGVIMLQCYCGFSFSAFSLDN